MGEELIKGRLYAVNKETGQEIEIGTVVDIDPQIEYSQKKEKTIELPLQANGEYEFEFTAKTISKKRFIKLLMAHRIQKRDAEQLHKIFMKHYKSRTNLGFDVFVNILIPSFLEEERKKYEQI